MITRFAPSPTGPLHLGHAYSAILAHDMARGVGGQFLLRMEDTDLQRSKPQWEEQIIEDLTWLGLSWDGPILHQAPRIDDYNHRLERLFDLGICYPCSCSRADIRAALAAPQEGTIQDPYPGTCRGKSMSDFMPSDAIRLDLQMAKAHLTGQSLGFVETGPKHFGPHTFNWDHAIKTIGDIVLSRKGEQIVSYFLASAFDDADQGVTDVIRGEDLFDFTPVQVVLQKLFDLPTPHYHHHTLIRDEYGKRLAKRDDARAIAKFRDEGATPDYIRKMVGL